MLSPLSTRSDCFVATGPLAIGSHWRSGHIPIISDFKTPPHPPLATMRVLTIAAALFTTAASAQSSSIADASPASRSLQSAPQCLAQERLYDYVANDITNFLIANPEACCSVCSATTNCHAYTWTKYQGGSCYLKTKKTSSVFKGTDTDGSAYYVSGEVYKCQPVQTNRDLAGVDFKNVTASQPESCCAECRLTSGCSGFAWNSYNGGTCYLKTGPVLKVATTNVYAAVL